MAHHQTQHLATTAGEEKLPLRSLLKLVPLTGWVAAYDHRTTFRRAVVLAKGGAEGRQHHLRYLELWILVQSLLASTNVAAISLVRADVESHTLVHQVFVLLLGAGAAAFAVSIVSMTVLMLNVSACSPENYRTFALVAEGWSWTCEFMLCAAIYPTLFGLFLMPTAVLADPATLPVASLTLRDGRVLVGLLAVPLVLLPPVLFYINTVSIANVRGGLIESDLAVTDVSLRKGPKSVIDQVATRVLANSASSDETVLEDIWQARAMNSTRPPSLRTLRTLFQRDLGVATDEGVTIAEVVNAACLQLNVTAVHSDAAAGGGGSVAERAELCWKEMGCPSPDQILGDDKLGAQHQQQQQQQQQSSSRLIMRVGA